MKIIDVKKYINGFPCLGPALKAEFKLITIVILMVGFMHKINGSLCSHLALLVILLMANQYSYKAHTY